MLLTGLSKIRPRALGVLTTSRVLSSATAARLGPHPIVSCGLLSRYAQSGTEVPWVSAICGLLRLFGWHFTMRSSPCTSARQISTYPLLLKERRHKTLTMTALPGR